MNLPPPYCYLHLDMTTEKWTVPDEPGHMRVAVWTKSLIEATTASGLVDGENYRALYEDLIYQVGNKYPDESRHETAKRYIVGAESNTGEAAMSEAAIGREVSSG